MCVCVCVCVCPSVSLSVCAQQTSQSDQFKTVKATAMDFKFDVHVFRDSPDVPLKIFRNGGICKNSLGRDMHSHECLLVKYLYVACNAINREMELCFSDVDS